VTNAAAAHAEPPYKRATTMRFCLPGGSRASAARKTSRWSRTPDRPLMGWTARRAAVLLVLFRRPSIGKARCQPCDSTGGEHLFGSADSIAAPIMPGGTTSFGGTAKSVVAKRQAQRPEPAVMSTASMSISRVSPKAVMARKKTPFRISLETERLGGFGFAVPPFSGTLEWKPRSTRPPLSDCCE
jgi:hypothetical protein